jgi:peptidoglycan/LPS O-acetylase OafA/YrhL
VRIPSNGPDNGGPKDDRDGFRPDVEGLRGVAVLLVVLFHAGLLSAAPVRLIGGFIGVDAFFVISGFLITGLLVRERERSGSIGFAKFYARRVRRILPAAAVVLLVTIPAAFVLVTLVRRPDAMLDGATAALSIANVRFALTTDYFNPVNYSPFLHFWSLGVEEQFYFIWPALLLVAAWHRPRLGAGIVLGGVCAVSFMASVFATEADPSWAFYMLPTRAWQLAAGGLLAVGAGSFARVPGAQRALASGLLTAAGWLALAALVIEATTLDSNVVPYPGLAALVPTLATLLLIGSGPERLGPGVLLRLEPLRFVGRISYSLYLWHWPILILGGLALGGSLEMAAAGAAPALLTPGQAAGLVLLSVAVAYFSWLVVEEPFRRGRVPLPRPTRLVLAGVAGMAVVALLGAGFNYGARNELADLGGGDVALAAATGSPPAAVTASPKPAVTATSTATANATADPTPTPSPALTPALTPAPAQDPGTYAVTNGLRPTLGRAPTDYEAPWHAGCLGWARTETPPRAGDCVYGNPNGKYTVALIGDSHASALFPAVDAVATAHGWKLLVFLKINCSFVDIPLNDPDLKRPYTECANWNDTVLDRLNADPTDLVIVNMSRWIQDSRRSDDTVDAEGAAMGREMARLPATSRLLMIQDIPDPLYHNVPDCLSAHRSDYRDCSYSRSIAFNWDMGAREAIAAQTSGASLVDLRDAICPGTGDCPAVIDGMITFRDDHHLTATFSASIGPALDRMIVGVLTAEPTPPPPLPTPYAG